MQRYVTKVRKKVVPLGLARLSLEELSISHTDTTDEAPSYPRTFVL